MTTNRVLATLFCATAIAVAQSGGEIPSVFHEVRKEPRDAPGNRDLSLRRQRAARLAIGLFDREAAKTYRMQRGKGGGGLRVRMNLFPDVDMVVRWEKVEPIERSEGVVWSGAVEGAPLSQAVMVVTGGLVTGNIHPGGGLVYQIRPGEDGEHWISELDPASLPPEGEPLQQPEEPPVDLRVVNKAASADDDGSVIDVIVAYTAAARQGAGGAERMLQLIQLGVAETNQGYVNSRVNHRLRLVGYGEVDYTESGDFSADLNRLSSANDGVMDDLHAIRDRLGADLISLWVERGNYCGLAWMLQNVSRPNPDLGFSVVRRDCATGQFTFGHELGHNLGANHAPGDSTNKGAYPYSQGFKQMQRTPYFRSVMAYDCPGGCARINYWSSPDLQYQGSAIGQPSVHDNRTTLNNTAAIVASYRRSTQNANHTPPPGTATLPESTHPYADNLDHSWTYAAPGSPSSIEVTFDAETYVEEGWDYIVISDGTGREISGSPFTGNTLSGKTVTVPGATVRIRLISDESITFYGFKVTAVRPGSAGNGVDLVTTSFTASTTGTIGGSIRGLVARVRNDGQAAAGPFRIGFYWGTENGQLAFSGWSCDVDSLGAGLTFTCSGDIGVSGTIRPGTYTLVAIADDQRQTTDVNWYNNARASEGGPVTLR